MKLKIEVELTSPEPARPKLAFEWRFIKIASVVLTILAIVAMIVFKLHEIIDGVKHLF